MGDVRGVPPQKSGFKKSRFLPVGILYLIPAVLLVLVYWLGTREAAGGESFDLLPHTRSEIALDSR